MIPLHLFIYTTDYQSQKGLYFFVSSEIDVTSVTNVLRSKPFYLCDDLPITFI